MSTEPPGVKTFIWRYEKGIYRHSFRPIEWKVFRGEGSCKKEVVSVDFGPHLRNLELTSDLADHTGV